MYIGDGLEKGDYNDFNVMPRENIVRLVNYVRAAKYAGNSVSALGRVARWFNAHQPAYSTDANVRWSTLDELKTAMRWHGPDCSEADLIAAVTALPAAVGSSAEAWETWERYVTGQPESDDYTDPRMIAQRTEATESNQ